MRRVIFWCHLICGTTAGLVILMMSVTGVLLTYERQMIAWADRGYRSSATPGAQPLGMEALLGTQPQMPVSVTIRAAADAPVELSYGPDRILYVDAYSGKPLGEGSQGIRKFFSSVTQWHRWFGAAVERRATPRAITGACNLAFLVLLLTGAFLWFPPMIGRFRGGLTGKARDFNWHNVIGVWSVLPLIVIVASGVVMSYSWANNLVYRLTGSPVPAAVAAPGSARAGAAGQSVPMQLTGMDALFTRARQQVPGWQTATVRLAARGPLTFAIDQSHRGRPDKRYQLTLERRTAEVVRFETFAGNTLGRRVRSWLRFLHTGEAGGVAGQTVAGLVSAGAAVLVWTGISLAIRRLWSWRSRRAVKKEPEAVLQGR